MIIRIERRQTYVIVDKHLVDDKRLSFKAKGLALYLFGKPDNWNANIRHLSTVGPDGGSAVQSALKELEDNGYLTRRRVQGEDGRFFWECILSEKPCMEKPCMEKPDEENRDVIKNEETKNELVKNETASRGGGGELIANSTDALNAHAQLVALMQDNGFGYVTEITADALDEALEKYPPVEIDAAIRIAVTAGKPFWKYVLGILRKGVNSPRPSTQAERDGKQAVVRDWDRILTDNPVIQS